MLPYDPILSQIDDDTTSQAGPGPSTTAQARKKSSVVTTTITTDNGSESARVGACSNCRSRKIKCSGDRPICKTCAKNNQECDYPLHISRKRKGKSEADKTGASTSKRRQSSIHELGTPAPHHYATPALPNDSNSYVNNNQFPILDFTADSLPLHTQNGYDGTPVDNAWLESFLAYDFGDEVPLPLQSLAPQTSNGMQAGQVDMGSAGSARMEGDTDIKGEPLAKRRSQAKFRVPYFRFFGPTAIAPGYRQVIADVSAPPSPTHRHFALSALPTPVMDAAGEYPSVEAVNHLLPLFQLHFSYFFPLQPPPIHQYTSYPPHLINIICALAARYSPIYSGSRRTGVQATDESNTASHTWASKAKEQVSQRLAISDGDMVQTLLMISWYEFGQDRDSGLWMYSGMSLRMGQDLGLDSVCYDPAQSPLGHQSPRPRIAGSLLIQDAILTIGTGRSGMYPTPSSSTDIPHFPPLASSGLPDPFHHLIKIFAIAYQVTQVLVRPDVINAADLLEKAQSDLNEFNSSLPAELRFETSTFRNYAAISQGGAFVLIHLWFHTLIILAYQPTIIYSDLPSLEADSQAPASKEISASSAKTILDIVVFAELIDPKAITQPWVNYPLYTAGRTFLSQTLPTGTPVDNTSDPAQTGRLHMAKIARVNFQKVVDVLEVLESYWGGVRYIRSVLVQKGEGVAQISLVGQGEDLSVPDRVSEWIANASSKQNSDIMGLSFSGTMHSPTDSRFSVVYPKGTQMV